MTVILTPSQAQYIDEDNVCVESKTPPEVLSELKEIDEEYFAVYGKHLIAFR